MVSTFEGDLQRFLNILTLFNFLSAHLTALWRGIFWALLLIAFFFDDLEVLGEELGLWGPVHEQCKVRQNGNEEEQKLSTCGIEARHYKGNERRHTRAGGNDVG